MKTATFATITALIALVTTSTANAGFVTVQTDEIIAGHGTFSSNLSDQDAASLKGSWSVTTLFVVDTGKTDTNAVKRKAVENALGDVLINYENGKTTKGTWNNNKWKTSVGNSIANANNEVRQADTKKLATGTGSGKDITTVDLDWITKKDTNEQGEAQSGFYAFNYSFGLSDLFEDGLNLVNNYDQLEYLLFNFTLGADDHLEAIYLNGKLLKNIGAEYGDENWTSTSTVSGAYDIADWLDELKAEGNELSFIVHNDGHLGYSTKDGSNAFGMGVKGWIGISANANYDPDDPSTWTPKEPSDSATPEPATLLILGLGFAGLGLRRRFIKK